MLSGHVCWGSRATEWLPKPLLFESTLLLHAAIGKDFLLGPVADIGVGGRREKVSSTKSRPAQDKQVASSHASLGK